VHDLRGLGGVIPIVPTCFDKHGRLDPDSQANLLRYYLQSRVQGLAQIGNLTEYFTLTETEWESSLDLICREVRGAVPLIVSVGGADLRTAVNQIRAAEDHGIAAIMLRPPATVPREDPRIVMPYYLQLSLNVTSVVILQDRLIQGEVVLPTAMYRTLSKMVERIHYAKVEVPWTPLRLRKICAAVAGHWQLFGGQNGLFMIEESEAGAVGSMVGSDFTTHYVSIWHACRQKQWDRAWARFSHLLPLIRFQLQGGMGASAVKHNLAAEGIISCPCVRPPTPTLEKHGLETLAFLRNLAAVSEDNDARATA